MGYNFNLETQSYLFFLIFYLFFFFFLTMGVDSVDHCKCRDKHCGPKDEDSAAAKIHTNKLLDKAFYKAQCPSYEHMICERAVNCGFDHDKAANARRSLGGDCDNVKYPADDHNKEHQPGLLQPPWIKEAPRRPRCLRDAQLRPPQVLQVRLRRIHPF